MYYEYTHQPSINVFSKPVDIVAPPKNYSSFTIASFNLQIYGNEKSTNAPYNQRLHDIFSKYDILVFQEIRDIDGSSAKVLQATFPEHTCAVSEPEGKTSSKEQYMICFDNKFTKISQYTIGDYTSFERPPLALSLDWNNHMLLIVDMHLDPENVGLEANSLYTQPWAVLPTIIAGDGNMDCSYWDHPGSKDIFHEWVWIIPDGADTTQGKTDCAYDRYIIKYLTPTNWSVLKDVQGMSDHYAITAEVQE